MLLLPRLNRSKMDGVARLLLLLRQDGIHLPLNSPPRRLMVDGMHLSKVPVVVVVVVGIPRLPLLLLRTKLKTKTVADGTKLLLNKNHLHLGRNRAEDLWVTLRDSTLELGITVGAVEVLVRLWILRPLLSSSNNNSSRNSRVAGEKSLRRTLVVIAGAILPLLLQLKMEVIHGVRKQLLT